MSVDHSKPVGWWCPLCGEDIATLGFLRCEDHTHFPYAANICIPIFEPLPPGERPEAEEPDEETVCRSPSGGVIKRASGLNRRAVKATGDARWMAVHRSGMCEQETDLVGAILWVAEGVLP